MSPESRNCRENGVIAHRIEHRKKLVHSRLWRLLILRQLSSNNIPNHPIDRIHNQQHLIPRNPPIPSHIIEAETETEFLIRRRPRRSIQRDYKLPKINSSVLIRVQGPKDMFRERAGIAEWEILSVETREFGERQGARWRLFCEASVPEIEGLFVDWVQRR